MTTLVKEETDTTITYTGIGAMSGVQYIVKKSSPLDVRIVVPASIDGVTVQQTWQEFTAELDLHI